MPDADAQDWPNLALNRPSTQSSRSMFSNGEAPEDDAAGGNNGRIDGGYGFHTGLDQPSWWMVDLQLVCRIMRVRLHNRLAHRARLRHFSLLASHDGANWRVAHQKTDDRDFGGADGDPFTLDFAPPLQARFLQIRQDDALFLHFDEFEAFGERPADAVEPPPPPMLRGLAEPAFAEVAGLDGFGSGRGHQRLVLLPAMEPPPQCPARYQGTPDALTASEHDLHPTPPAIACLAVAGGQIWGSGLVTLDGQFVLPRDCFPYYLRDQLTPAGHGFDIPVLNPGRWAARETLRVALPVVSALHPNFVFGHFLLEMLPRLYVASLLRHLGGRFMVALPTTLPDWARAFVTLYVPEAERLWFDPARVVIEAPSVILPSMMHDQHNFHPAFNLMVADLRARVGLPSDPTGLPRPADSPRHIYLSRRLVRQNRRLQNEDEVEARMERLGFAIVHPQRLSLREQLVLFDAAEVVAGEYSSALHNTLFSRPGTRVICLDCFSAYQSSLGRVRQQPHGFVPPADGGYRNWRSTRMQDRVYRIDPDALQALVLDMVPEAAAALHAPPKPAAEPIPPAAPPAAEPPQGPIGSLAVLLGQAPFAAEPAPRQGWLARMTSGLRADRA